MLSHIDIHGLAIIDALSMELDPGFNVITGETGAGKSILIKALGLLLGAKASPETVRSGVDTAAVTGTFEVPLSHPAAGLLGERGIPIESDAEADDGRATLLVRRTIGAKGRSKAWVNDVPVTVGLLRDLAATLIDVFAQHENQRLLDASRHTEYLDRYLTKRDPLDAVEREYAACADALKEIVDGTEDFRERRRDADYVGYRSEELDRFDPSADDFARVSELCQRAGGELEVRETFARAQSLVDEGAGGEPVSQPLWEVARLLGRSEDVLPIAKELAGEASDLAGRLDDLSYRLGSTASGLDIDEASLQAAQDRLAGYQDLFRKFAVADIDGLLAERERLQRELSFLESAAFETLEKLRTLRDRAQVLREAAAKLRRARGKAKDRVKKRVESELHELAMPDARIEVELVAVERPRPDTDLSLFGEEAVALFDEAIERLDGVGEHGSESARFLLASNPGEPALPLHKVASGGEVSRIMLALKKGLAAGADTCILVFDEIDSGISGRVADVVGRKMQELGETFQVICISHLAQVAAYAGTHFRVEKHKKSRRTEVDIRKLTQKESEEAIARLLSGSELSKSSLANARSLVRKAREAATSKA